MVHRRLRRDGKTEGLPLLHDSLVQKVVVAVQDNRRT
jgi:hypothetical protein